MGLRDRLDRRENGWLVGTRPNPDAAVRDAPGRGRGGEVLGAGGPRGGRSTPRGWGGPRPIAGGRGEQGAGLLPVLAPLLRGVQRRRDHRGAALETLRLVRGRDLSHDAPAPGARRDGGPTCPAKRASAPKRPDLRVPERPPKDSHQTSPVLHPRPTSGETGCEASRRTTPKPLLLRRPESRRAEVPKAVADGALARHRLEVAGLVGLPGNSLPSLSAIHSATPMRASRSIPSRAP